MSLEEKLAENTAALLANTAILTKIASSAPAAADKPKGTRGKKAAEEGGEDTGGDATFDVKALAAVREEVKDWLSEFKANEADPETAERRKVLDAALIKLGGGKTPIKIADISDDAMTARVKAWIDKKNAEGRLTGPLEDDEAGAADDDEI